MTFEEFMEQKYAEAAEYSAGVTREQKDIAREAWDAATLAEREACAELCDSLYPPWNDPGDCAGLIRARSDK